MERPTPAPSPAALQIEVNWLHEKIVELVQGSNLRPGDVFPEDALREWATGHGYLHRDELPEASRRRLGV